MTGLSACPDCRAPHGADEAVCWMCGRRFWTESATAPAAEPPPAAALPEPPAARQSRRSQEFTLPALLAGLLLLLAGLVLGAGQNLAVLFLLLFVVFFIVGVAEFAPAPRAGKIGGSAPVYLITTSTGQKKIVGVGLTKKVSRPMSLGRAILTTVVVVVAGAAALSLFLFTICTVAFASMGAAGH